MVEVAPNFPARNLPVLLPVSLIGKTGTPGNPEIPETGKNGKNGNDDKRLPWTRCMVLWDNFGSGVCNIRVVRHPATWRHPQTFSDGACWMDWADGKRRPADLFGALLAQGFANKVEQRRALAEFGTVTGCGWAGRMLAGLKAWEGEA
ncbi:MAG TPA: hypothetical protein PK752_03840 [Accumulibacter sp.]|uniref:hypothetical protein n=1 Tax=Accumulibacter sp. TaxID=2053492 RepID=UPI002BAD8B01|nr:hypothetical protein [Accumulibacter sp.]HRD87380.1 hypothetical protein [Accumulibacter sp.]